MLSKNDIKQIDGLIQKRLKDGLVSAFHDFYENILEKHFDQSEKEHKEIREEIVKTREDLGEYIKDHEKRIRKLEVITAS